ncbi:MAG: cation transporter [Bacteroidales bacterium]|nr:cation transporter [Bacteroidales bacterium]
MHSSDHHRHEISGKNLGLAIFLNVFMTIAEAAGGIVSGSIALMSDAAHNFSDVISLIISWVANRLSRREATLTRTFGFRRSEILAAFINSATLIIVSIVIIIEAVKRISSPEEVSAGIMIWMAVASLIVNGLSALVLHRDSRENMNMRSAYLHLFGDMLTSVAVLAGGLAVRYMGWNWADSIISVAIALYLLWLSRGIFVSSLRIIMQFTPEDINIKEIASEIEKIPGVRNIHHVHVWQINEHDLMFEAHLDLEEDVRVSGFEEILGRIKTLLAGTNIRHVTIQPEFSVDDRKQMIW